jgi:hypothetical protein
VATNYTFGGKRPYALTWTLGVQREFKKDYILEVRYVGTTGVQMWNQTRLNIDPQVTPNNFIPTYIVVLQPNERGMTCIGEWHGGLFIRIAPKTRLGKVGFVSHVVTITTNSVPNSNRLLSFRSL